MGKTVETEDEDWNFNLAGMGNNVTFSMPLFR